MLKRPLFVLNARALELASALLVKKIWTWTRPNVWKFELKLVRLYYLAVRASSQHKRIVETAQRPRPIVACYLREFPAVRTRSLMLVIANTLPVPLRPIICLAIMDKETIVADTYNCLVLSPKLHTKLAILSLSPNVYSKQFM